MYKDYMTIYFIQNTIVIVIISSSSSIVAVAVCYCCHCSYLVCTRRKF